MPHETLLEEMELTWGRFQREIAEPLRRLDEKEATLQGLNALHSGKPTNASKKRQKELLVIYEVRRTLEERAFYPEHEARSDSSAYRTVRKRLIQAENLPCLVCGVTYAITKNKKLTAQPKLNPYYARQMETHHRLIEWSISNAVDLGRFNRRVLPRLRERNPRDPLYASDLTQGALLSWIDHHPDNLWVLCDVHHRAKYVGIHQITGPIWGPMDLLKDEFHVQARRELGVGQGRPRGAKRRR